MNRWIQVIGLSLAVFSLAAGISAPKQAPSKAAASQKQTTSPREFGQSYATLRPEQKKLLEDYIRR